MSYYNNVKSNQINWPWQEHTTWSRYSMSKKIFDNRLKFHYEKYGRVDACESVMYYFVQEDRYYTKQVLNKKSKDYFLARCFSNHFISYLFFLKSLVVIISL